MSASHLTSVPRAGLVPDGIARLRYRVVLAAVLFSAIAGPCSLVASAGRGASANTVVGYRYQGFAQVAAQDYLAGRPTSLPIATGLSPLLGRQAPPVRGIVTDDRPRVPVAFPVTSLAWVKAEHGKIGPALFETHTFVASISGRLWNVAVTVLTTPDGPVVASNPAVTPAKVGKGTDGIDYSKLAARGTLSGGGVQQVESWGKAFAEGDEQTLYRLTGDQQERRYAALGGQVLMDSAVLSTVSSGGHELVQVRLTMRSVANPDIVFTSDYDLLLGGTKTKALPDIQAWGPAGSGPELQPFQNAVSTDSAPDGSTTTTTIDLYVPQPGNSSSADPAASNPDGIGQ